MKTIYLTEANIRDIIIESVSCILSENRERTADERSKAVIRNFFSNGSWLDREFVHEDNPQHMTSLEYMFFHFKETFFAGNEITESPVIRLEPMICKIAFESGFQQYHPDRRKLNRLKTILNHILLINKLGKINLSKIDINNTTFEDLERDFGVVIDDINRKKKEKINNTNYDEPVIEDSFGRIKVKSNGYTIIGPITWSQANTVAQFSGFIDDNGEREAKICYANNRTTWDQYTQDNTNHVYVCLKDGWKDIPPEHDDSTMSAYDTYGLSMIFVIVDDEGNLTTCNTRWNHNATFKQGRWIDYDLDEEDLSEILGVNFYKVFK